MEFVMNERWFFMQLPHPQVSASTGKVIRTERHVQAPGLVCRLKLYTRQPRRASLGDPGTGDCGADLPGICPDRAS